MTAMAEEVYDDAVTDVLGPETLLGEVATIKVCPSVFFIVSGSRSELHRISRYNTSQSSPWTSSPHSSWSPRVQES